MKLQSKPCKVLYCFSSRVNSHTQVASDSQSISQSSHSYYQSSLPCYWRTNYYLFDRPCYLQLVNPAQLSDRIEDNLLIQHRQVIIQELLSIECCFPGYETLFYLFQCPLNEISELEFDNYFYQHLLSFQIFENWEAGEFKHFLQMRKDYKQLYFYFVELLDKGIRLEITYLFYTSIKLLEQLHQQIKPTTPQLEYLIDFYLQSQACHLREKLICLGFSENFQMHIKKIMFTILLALVGIFNNKFFNHKIEYITSMRMHQNHALKKLRIINSRPKSQCNLINQIMPRKRIKISTM